jgi:hypothetical protein
MRTRKEDAKEITKEISLLSCVEKLSQIEDKKTFSIVSIREILINEMNL